MQQEAEAQARRWLEQAKRDLEDARFNREGGRFALACFLAQQSAEKALKAFIYSAEADLVWGHSVANLCDDAARYDSEFSTLKPTLSPLDKYYVARAHFITHFRRNKLVLRYEMRLQIASFYIRLFHNPSFSEGL